MLWTRAQPRRDGSGAMSASARTEASGGGVRKRIPKGEFHSRIRFTTASTAPFSPPSSFFSLKSVQMCSEKNGTTRNVPQDVQPKNGKACVNKNTRDNMLLCRAACNVPMRRSHAEKPCQDAALPSLRAFSPAIATLLYAGRKCW